jgi:hypothetical protein
VVKKSGYRHWRRKITLQPGDVQDLTAVLEEKPATLRIVSLFEGHPTWATISVDDEVVGEQQAVKREVRAGTHLITARREGYREIRQPVTVGPGEVLKVKLVLEKK